MSLGRRAIEEEEEEEEVEEECIWAMLLLACFEFLSVFV